MNGLVQVVDGLLLVGDLPGHDVPGGDDSDELVAVDDGEMADVLFRDDGAALIERRVGPATGDGRGHHIGDTGGGRIVSSGDDTGEDVAFGEDADDVVALLSLIHI